MNNDVLTLVPAADLQHSEAIDAIAAALSRAHGEMKAAPKDSENPFFKSEYASLFAVIEAERMPLANNELAYVQSPTTDGNHVSVTTLLMHSSGQWIKGILSAHAKDDSPQAIGSCISYLRRYALQSFLGIPSKDDDAQDAQPKQELSRPMSAGVSLDYSTSQVIGPVAHDGPLRITRVDTAPIQTKKGKFTKAIIMLSDGRKCSTIYEPKIVLAKTLCDRNEPCAVTVKSTDFGLELVTLARLEPSADDDPTYDDSIPF